MFTIVEKKVLAPKVTWFRVESPLIAKRHKPGQFVLLRVCEEGERFPLTIADSDKRSGTIVLVSQEVGKSTGLLAQLEQGDAILDVVGPLGKPTEIKKFGTVACIAGGIGAAPLYPIAKKMLEVGNRVVVYLGARNREAIILQHDLSLVSDRLLIATDDGSSGYHGVVSELLRQHIRLGESCDHATAIGPLPMMKAVCAVTREYDIPTIVSLNPIMVDGTGMCGGCRVRVGGRIQFACVDGPEFDGHAVDFDSLSHRLRMYRDHEKCAMEKTGVPDGA